jgi:hypothetical protein
MTKTVGEVADELRAARDDRFKSQRALASLLAETIDLRHEPPHPTDGPIPGRLLAEVSLREVEAVGRAMPDVSTESDVAVEGDAIRVRGRTTGTLADGTRIDIQTHTVFTVAGGAIVALQSEMDEVSMATWGQVLMAGGFEIPEVANKEV